MNSNFTEYYIGCCLDSQLRFKASSGGIGSAVQKFLLTGGKYGTGLTFFFNQEKCMYEPKLIYSPDEINVCGSIYQDINIIYFIKSNLKKIKSGIVLTCSPCQVKPVKWLLDKNNIPNFIISFCCSGQTTIEGTWKYYDMLGIKKEDVENLQYRGNGWPSGMQIKLKDGREIFHRNWTEPWISIHSSAFYRPKRCFYCQLDTSYISDISIADPWLKHFIDHDKIGNTLFLVNTDKGASILRNMKEKRFVDYYLIDYNSYYTAQKSNIEKANRIKNQQKYMKWQLSLIEWPLYRNFFSKTIRRMKIHNFIRRRLFDFSSLCNFKKMIAKLLKKCKTE